MAPTLGKNSQSLWNIISPTNSDKSVSSSPSSSSASSSPRQRLAVTRKLSVSENCLSSSQAPASPPAAAPAAEKAVMAGWVTKLVGGRLRSWRRKFLVLDRHGTLSMYSTKKDATLGKKPSDVVTASNIRSVVRRERVERGQWPHSVGADVCIQVHVLKGRTHSLVCDSKAECVEWLRKLSPFAGNPRTEPCSGEVAGRAGHGHATGGRRDSLDCAVRSPPKPTSTGWSASQLTSDPSGYGLHEHTTIPAADCECFLKWLKVAELTLQRFEKMCKMPPGSMSLECNMEWLFSHTPAEHQPRLGEYLFGDYPDELLHNFAPMLEHPVGRALLLSRMPASKISIVYESNQIRHKPAHSVSEHDGSLQLSIDPRRLGQEMTSVGLAFLDSCRVSRSQLIRSDHCGDIVFVSYLAAVDILNVEQHFANSYAVLRHYARWPRDDAMQISCLWYDLEAAVLSHPAGGFEKARKLGRVVLGGVVVPLLQHFTAICRQATSYPTSTSLYYKLSRKTIVIEVNRQGSASKPLAPIQFTGGRLYLRPTASQLVLGNFDEVIESYDIAGMATHSETIV